MMADLLEIDGAAIDPALVGFSQNRIERFFHMYGKSVFSHHEDDRVFHSFQRVFDLGCPFGKDR